MTGPRGTNPTGPCNGTGARDTVIPVRTAVWLAPVRNLVWVAARFGHR